MTETPQQQDLQCATCGKPFSHYYEVYRCADCEMPFHRDCMRKVHFKEQVAPYGSERDELIRLRENLRVATAALAESHTELTELDATARELLDNARAQISAAPLPPAPPDPLRLINRVNNGEATLEEILLFVEGQLRDALDAGNPPAEGRQSDSWHASACVLRAWATLTSTRMQNLRREAAIEAVRVQENTFESRSPDGDGHDSGRERLAGTQTAVTPERSRAGAGKLPRPAHVPCGESTGEGCVGSIPTPSFTAGSEPADSHSPTASPSPPGAQPKRIPQNTIALLRDAIVALTGATDYLEQFGAEVALAPPGAQPLDLEPIKEYLGGMKFAESKAWAQFIPALIAEIERLRADRERGRAQTPKS